MSILYYGEIYEVEAKPGMYVKPDGWSVGQFLISGDSFSALRLETGHTVIESLAVEIEITGRKFRYLNGSRFIRVKIIFLGDCEPNQETRGWMKF
jgi:hypothetical protein